MMKKLFLLASMLPLLAAAQQLSSPDGKYAVAIDGMTYHVTYNNKVVIEKSQLGVDIDNRLDRKSVV